MTAAKPGGRFACLCYRGDKAGQGSTMMHDARSWPLPGAGVAPSHRFSTVTELNGISLDHELMMGKVQLLFDPQGHLALHSTTQLS